MIGTRLGEYEVVSRLGVGAMGAVYLGVRSDGTRVALKVLHPHLVEEPGFFRRFEREASVGLSVDHENVVSVLDYEMLLADQTPTCVVVMEYVEGRTLRQLLVDLDQVPEVLLREIASQIAAGLDAIHAQGVVHRDLKPDNVLITDDHRVRIMDLGVAKVLDASLELTQGGGFAGTLAYAAPEQLRGEAVTPACDLYALGVTLYELATGDNPFRHEDSAVAIATHVNVTPPRINEQVEEVSPFLTELVASLLAKAPEDRVASASEVCVLLEESEASAWWQSRASEATRVAALDTLVPVRRETRLQGRESELAALREAYEAAEQREGAVVLVTGEAGLGKSRLVDEFLHTLHDRDVRVLYGSYSPSGGEDALAAAVLHAFGRSGLAGALEPRILESPGLAPAFAAHLRHEAPPDGALSLSAEALHTVYCCLAKGLAAEKTTIWIVEDLHFANEDARKRVLSLARVVAGSRVLLLATTRPGLSEEGLEPFGRLEGFRALTLGRLSPREVIALLRDAFRSARLADKLGAKIAYKSDGVPFFVFEMIRGLREGNFITQLPDGSWVETKVIDEIEVPSAVRDLLAVRVGSLSDDDRALLDVAAVDGYTFDPDVVAWALDLPRLHVLQRLAAIERRHGLVRAEEQRVRFDHHLIREVLYDEVPAALRREYHHALGDALELRGSCSTVEPLRHEGDLTAALCRHFLCGTLPKRATRYLDAALDHLGAEFRNEEAIELADLALAIPDLLGATGRLDVLLKKNDRLDMLGRRERQEAVLAEALALAERAESRAGLARVEHALGSLYLAVGRTEEAKDHLGSLSSPRAGDRGPADGGARPGRAGPRGVSVRALWTSPRISTGGIRPMPTSCAIDWEKRGPPRTWLSCSGAAVRSKMRWRRTRRPWRSHAKSGIGRRRPAGRESSATRSSTSGAMSRRRSTSSKPWSCIGRSGLV